MTNSIVMVLMLPIFVHSSNKCFQCASLMDDTCKGVLELDFPNVCYPPDDLTHIKCYVYSYNTSDNTTQIDRGCKIATETCKHTEDALRTEHKTLLGCHMCEEDLCNNILTETKQTNSTKNSEGTSFSQKFFLFLLFPLLFLNLL